MSDGSINTMHTMADIENKEEEVIEEEEGVEAEQEAEESADDADAPDSSKKTEDLDLDAEIEKERKANPEIAKKAFKDREKKRETEDSVEDDEDAPLTRKDLASFEQKIRKDAQKERALEIAKGMAGSDKEAELIVLKWGNRTFPKDLSLAEQIEEAYVITHSKRIIGEKNEALRALKGKDGVQKNAATTHRDLSKGAAPKIAPDSLAAIRKSGFTLNTSTQRYEKKTGNGRTLVYNVKTKQIQLEKA